LTKRINWLEVKVTDIKEAVAFLWDVIGLRVKQEWPNYVIFDLSGTLTFEIMLGGKRGERKVHQISILPLKTLMQSVSFVEPPKKQYWGGYAALFADPDENLLYLVEVKDQSTGKVD